MEGLRDRAATVEMCVGSHAGHVFTKPRTRSEASALPSCDTTVRLDELLRDFKVCVLARPLIVAVLCAIPMYQASALLFSFGGEAPRAVVVSMFLLLAPLFVASYLFATKVCFDAVSPVCPRCARKLEHLGSVPHTSGFVDFGPTPRLYACSDCSERFTVGGGGGHSSVSRVRHWRQPIFGELQINEKIYTGAPDQSR